MNAPVQTPKLAHNVTRLSRLDLPGSGQVYVDGKYAYFGHITNKERLGTSIVDISDPKKPKLVSQIKLDDPESHSHKARVIGDIMIVNSERNGTAIGRKAAELPKLRTQTCARRSGASRRHKELAEKLGVKESDIAAVEAEAKTPYQQRRLQDLRRLRPREAEADLVPRAPTASACTASTWTRTTRTSRPRPKATSATSSSSTTSANPTKPEEVSKWWIPGQHLAGGEKPTWPGRQHRLHHTLRVGDRLYAGCWHGGVRIVDVSDIRKPKTIGAYNYHPPFPEPSHTFMALPKKIDGRQIAVAIDEEDHAHSAEEMAQRRGRPHAALWTFDITDPAKIQPLAIFEVSELDSPWSRATPGRFGAHQFQEHMKGGDTLMYCAWFAGGLAHRRRRRPARAAGSGLVHSRARRRQGRAAVERRGRGREGADLSRGPLRGLRHPRVQPRVTPAG